MKNKFILSATLVFAASFPWQASAGTFDFSFNAPGITGNVQLTYGTATDARYSEALEVTGISGTFSDTNNGLNIVNAAIGSLVPVTHDTPEPSNLLAPNDFSRFAVASGLDHGSLAYDNLYWPGGSPQTASDYPPHGGFVDIYGLLFNIGNGRVVNFWSNGDLTGAGPNFGVALATSNTSLDYVQGNVSVSPEPGAFALLASGLVGVFFLRKRAARQ